jgi:pimeloyl-ACP methyl ester carboxylesterase
MGIGCHASRVTLQRPDWSGDHAPLARVPDADPAAEPESLVVTVDTGDRIHYLDWGSRAGPIEDAKASRAGREVATASPPPLVLVHGLSQTAWSWAPVARRLCRVTRVLAVDLRGHGLSDAPRTGYGLESLATDVLTVMVANGWGRDVGGPPAVVAGHGFGATVAASVAALQPDSVAGLALVDGGWEGLAEATGLSLPEYVEALAEPPEVLASMGRYLADRRDYDPPSWDADQERAARSQVEQKPAGHVAPVTRQAVVRAVAEAAFTYRPDEVLPAYPGPVLIVVASSGSADDEAARERRLALDDAVRARAAVGAAPPRVATFTGSGHNLMRYRPGPLAAELLALLGVSAGGNGVS